MAPDHSQRLAVRHDEQALAGVRARDPREHLEHAREMRLGRLAIVVGHAGKPRRDLERRQPGPAADVDLA